MTFLVNDQLLQLKFYCHVTLNFISLSSQFLSILFKLSVQIRDLSVIFLSQLCNVVLENVNSGLKVVSLPSEAACLDHPLTCHFLRQFNLFE